MSEIKRILWLSDIHFAERDYIKNEELLDSSRKNYDLYYENFIKKVKNYKDGEFDYIIISGDLIFSGKNESYEKFKEKIFDELKKNCNRSKIIICPGNHDVNWDNVDYKEEKSKKIYENFINDFNDFNSVTGEPKLIERNPEFFKKLFNDYTKFFNDNVKNQFDDKFVSNNSYKDSGLYGLVKDEENKIAFIIINTAWLSLGYNFEKVIKQKFEDEYDNHKKNKTEIINNFNKRIEELKKVNEYGRQSMALSQFISDDFLKEEIFQKNSLNDYFVITIMHHPFSWINENERFCYNSIEDTKKLPINKILEKTDLLLSGHEHLAITNSYKKILDVIHLESGKLLDVDDQFFNNRFSILELSLEDYENKKFAPKLVDKRFYTIKKDDSIYQWKWKNYDDVKIELKKFANKIDTPSKRLSKLAKKVKSSNAEKVAKYLNNKLYKYNELNLENLTDKDLGKVFVGFKEKEKKIVLLYLGNNFENEPFNFKDYFLKNLKDYEEIIFLVPDFSSGYGNLTQLNLLKYYEKKIANYKNRGETYLEISDKVDLIFNKMRNDYFEKAKLSDVNIDIKFVINTVAYWDVERYFL